ncbi:hypothetical protein [Pectinatus haikarae]|uniref:Holin n=1 Tax=Pectinatus haikarae TaxID=349096 RepID=A0ABT9Y3R1_9FIRM|nr:hypothetical protein [Pectinatus haikarae]MDQ0202461.1 hypothetical protein [Pectinatus haikarae]
MNDKKHIWDFLSADEQKLSALILCLFALVTVSGVECFRTGDIPGNLKDLTETVILAVAGMNVAGRISMAMQKKGVMNNDNQNSDAK